MYTYKIIYHCSDFEEPQTYLYKGTTLMNAIIHAKKFIDFMTQNNLGRIDVVRESRHPVGHI